MKLLITYIQRIMMLALLVSTMVACSDKESYADDEEQNSAVLLRIAIGGPANYTRAVPTGGEHGDGLEPGQHHENDINTLSLYACADGINGNAATPVRLVAYLTNLNLTMDNADIVDGMFVYEVRVDDKFVNGYTFSAQDKFIVVTNTQALGASTLGELRDSYVTKPVQNVAEGMAKNGCTNFVMSNERESSYVDGVGSPEDPHLIKVNIERVTARVDLITTGSVADAATQSLLFSAVDGPADTKVADVYVSHARVFNAMTAPSYVIKRLGNAENQACFYLADETNPASFYVIEPNTWKKATTDASLLTSWYGNSHVSKVKQLGDGWFRNADRVHIASPSAGNDGFATSVSVDDAGYNYYVLDYVNENTMTPENTTANVTTGIMLKAVYKPANVYKGFSGETPIVDTEYAYGQTFWRYRPIGQVYDETKSVCFSSLAAANDYRNAHPEQLAEITEYTGGMCYYPVYLRHDNTLVTPYINKMEYGIVRNNIYRLKVSFTGPGYPSLDLIDERDPEGIRPYIFVRKWYKIMHPEIEI